MTDSMRDRVVVTGIGSVTGYGAGTDALWRGLLSGRPAIRPIARFDPSSHRTQLAAEVPPPLGKPLDPRSAPSSGRRERWTLCDRFALAAAKEACAQARLEIGPATRAAGVFFGSSTGGMLESEWFYARLTGLSGGRAPLSWVPAQQYNGPGDAVARLLQAQGPVETLSSACTSGALSVLEAYDALRSGELDLALAGGSDSLCQLTHAGFNSLRAVDHDPSRPFREDRAGLTLGEGAGVLVLETAQHAARRGVPVLAELLAGASTCDAHHMTAPAPDGGGAARAISQTLSEAAVEAGEVDFVSAHGTGTPLNDAAEWQALASVFGERAGDLPVTSIKGSIGHLLGAAGSIEAVATVRCLREGKVHPTPGEGLVDPEAPVRLVRQPLESRDLAVGLSINLAFGGSNAALLFRKGPA